DGYLESFDVDIMTRNGEIRSGILSVQPIEVQDQQCLLTVVNDITERKQADKEIRESEERFRTIFEVANDAMIYLDEDGTVLDMNDKLEDIFGYTREEVLGKILSEIPFLDPGQMTRMVDLFADAVSMKGPRLVEFELLHKDGHPVFVEASSTTVIDRAGIKGALTILRDITERKKVEEKRARISALEELDQLRTALLASVSHELRTPLTSIKGLASTLVQPDVEWDAETQKDFLKNIVQESDKLNHIVSDLLEMSLLEAGIMKIEKTDTRISAIVKQVDNELRNITQMHSLEINIPPNIPKIHVDEIRIGEVITNLVSNATSYSEEGSKISLEAMQTHSNIVVSVTDEGIGVPPEYQDKVFDRFYRLESGVSRRRGGSGLGLAICKGIVERHGGQISIESKLGEGSKFSFSIPIDDKM
ncbi:MAG: PAS domain S-box protein, partial [Planctomycetes bacterium]|nr:PAS domain S-box protein [Planctomycetota bacterium]